MSTEGLLRNFATGTVVKCLNPVTANATVLGGNALLSVFGYDC